MRKLLTLVLLFTASCSLNSLNPFSKKEQHTYQPYVPKQELEPVNSNLKGVDNVVFYIRREFSPAEGEIVLNSYDGFIIDLGSEQGVHVGDRFISESGAILKVKEVKKNYSIALPTLGNPQVGESVRKYTFNRVLLINFAGEKGKKLYERLKEKVPRIPLADYDKGESFKKTFKLKFPADFKRKVPVDELTGYDGYLVVTEQGVELFDGTKKLLRVYPWEGAPASTFSLSPEMSFKVVLDLKGHGTSLFIGNVDSSPDSELVLTTENDVRIYKLKPYGLKLVKQFKNPFPGSYLFHVSPVDLNGDGKFEFVIDGFYQDTKSVSGGLFKVNKGKLEKIASTNLILSTFDTDGDGINDRIWGQRVSTESDKLFSGDVWELELSDGKLKKGNKIDVPKEFQVTSAQVFVSGGKKYFAYYDLDYYFNVSLGKERVWRSPIQIGASPNCLYWTIEDNLVSYYITPKPKPIDMDGDGNEEVLFSQNKNAVPGILRNIYTFDGGRVLLLYRNGSSFSWEEATNPLYKHGGIEEFDYAPDYDVFISIFTEVNILKNPESKVIFLRPKI